VAAPRLVTGTSRAFAPDAWRPPQIEKPWTFSGQGFWKSFIFFIAKLHGASSFAKVAPGYLSSGFRLARGYICNAPIIYIWGA